MQVLYMRSRRILAGVLAVALSVCAVMTLVRDPQVVGVVVGIVGIVVAALLVLVAVLPGIRLRRDTSAFLSGAICLGACQGTLGRTLSAAGYMVVPAVVVAICCATVAVMVQAEIDSQSTKDRL
ncbi:hypothetical protein [Cutibacterium sp. V947]|uniref:hypothetical protein n=1 Tax=unclassified Cutibacterium TaxID=2649671 RepID=UPI003EE22A2D